MSSINKLINNSVSHEKWFLSFLSMVIILRSSSFAAAHHRSRSRFSFKRFSRHGHSHRHVFLISSWFDRHSFVRSSFFCTHAHVDAMVRAPHAPPVFHGFSCTLHLLHLVPFTPGLVPFPLPLFYLFGHCPSVLLFPVPTFICPVGPFPLHFWYLFILSLFLLC